MFSSNSAKLIKLIVFLFVVLAGQAFSTDLSGTWYTGSNNGTPSLSDPDSNSFTWGTAGSATETAQAGGLWSYFTPISLANDGDSIALSFTVTPGQTATTQSLRFGIFNSGGSKVENNLSGSNSDDGFLSTMGYFSVWNQSETFDSILYARAIAKTNPLSTTNVSGQASVEQTASIENNSPVLTENVSYEMTFTLTRNSASEYFVSSSVDGAAVSGTTATINTASFDTVVFLNTPNGIDSFSFSNLQINYSPAAGQDFINFNDYTILSYGGSQDVEGTAVVENDGATLHLTGNVWKCIQLPFTIMPGTVLEFDFQSNVQGEEHSLGMDIDLDIQPDNRIKLYGTQTSGATLLDFNDYASYAPNTRHYVIPIGQYYTGSMQYLFFANDHDVTSPTGESVFSNVIIHDTGDYPPQPAHGPQPANNTTEVSFAAELSLNWSAGNGSNSHEVYFGTDYNGVFNADTNSAEYYIGNQTETTFSRQSLSANTTYYWRIDEVNQYGVTAGAIWSFTTTESLNLVIDDFEGYYGNNRYAAVPVSGYDLLLENWKDGTINSSGAQILDLQEGCLEFSFDNSASPYYSQVERTFASPVDLITSENFRYVSMWYKGSANASGLYLKLYNGDSNETLRIIDPAVYQSEYWQEIVFDLGKLELIDPTVVTKIVIGVSEETPAPSATTGMVRIDDIKMYVCRDVPAFRVPADINGDCQVNIEDIALLSGYWLTSGYYVDAADPGNSSLVAHYAMNDGAGTTVSDSVNNYDGTVIPTDDTTTVWGASDGYEGGCLIFDGTFSVQLPANVFSTVTGDFSVCVWLYSDSQGGPRDVDPVEFNVNTSSPESVTWGNSESDPGDYVDTWNHFAFVKDSTQGSFSIYKNGYLVSRSTVSSDAIASPGVSVIGLDLGGQEYYSGKMDQLRIYDDAMMQEEILYLVSGAGASIYQSAYPVFVPFDPFKDGRIDLSDLSVIAESWNP